MAGVMDLALRNAVIADGTGRERFNGDVGISAGRIAVVFDPDTIARGPVTMRDDLPGQQCRLYVDSIGIHHVIVNGVPVARGNEPTGRIGGKVLRSGRDTFTVPLGT